LKAEARAKAPKKKVLTKDEKRLIQINSGSARKDFFGVETIERAFWPTF